MTSQNGPGVGWGLSLANFFATLGSVNFGFALAWTAASLNNINNDLTMPDLNQSQQNWISSVLAIGAIIGTFVGADFSERFSRHTTLVLTAIPAFSGWISLILAKDVVSLMIGRFFVGVSVGFVNTGAPGFVAEITPPYCRGFMGGLFQIGIYFGTFLCLLLSPYVGWRILSLVGLVCGLSMSCGLVFMKQTCEKLIEENMLLQSASESSKDDWVDKESSGIEENLSLLDSLREPHVYKPFILCVIMALAFQLSATSAISFYNIQMFTNTGLSVDAANAGSQSLGAAQFLLGIIGSFFSLRFNRKPYYFATAFLVTIGLVSVATFYLLTQKERASTSRALNVAVICSFIFSMSSFAFGVGTITWAYIGEILPPECAGFVVGSASFTNWSVSFFLTFFFNDMVDGMNNYGVFYWYACFHVATTCLLIPWLPETKGKTLAQIQAAFKSGSQASNRKNDDKRTMIEDTDDNPFGNRLYP